MQDFRALTFDCYGTLIDWETGILAVLRPWADRAELEQSDEALLGAYAEAESEAERASPAALYRDVLQDTMRRIGAALGAEVNDADEDALSASVGDWPPFPDTTDALRRLQSRCRLVIASNVDRESFARTARLLGVEFDAVITAEDVGSYKPALGHFHHAEKLLVERRWIRDRSEWLHVAQSLHHDHVPAKSLGLRTAWIDRRAGRTGGATPESSAARDVRPDYTFRSLAEFADAMGV